MLNLESGKKGAPAEPVGYWECPKFLIQQKWQKREFEKGKEITAPVEGLWSFHASWNRLTFWECCTYLNATLARKYLIP